MTTYQKYLVDCRTKANLTQAQVSLALGYKTPQFVSNWERGLSHPPIDVIPQLAALYNIDADNLFELYLRDYLAEISGTLRKKYFKKTKTKC